MPDVLLYNPIESAWVFTSADMLDVNLFSRPTIAPEGKQVYAIDRSYKKAINDLTEGRIEFLIGDRHYLAEMKVKDGRLVRGPLKFQTMVLPQLRMSFRSTVRGRCWPSPRQAAAFTRWGNSFRFGGKRDERCQNGGDHEGTRLAADIHPMRAGTGRMPSLHGRMMPTGNTSPMPRNSDSDR